MLALASHEPNFSLLRNEVTFSRNATQDVSKKVLFSEENYQLLHIGVLREYLDLEFRESVVREMLSLGTGSAAKAIQEVSAAVSDSAVVSTDSTELTEVLNSTLSSLSNQLQSGDPLLSLRIKDPKDQLAKLASPSYPFLPSLYSIERLVDDFILVCILVGNDFLPHMAFSDITKGGLNQLFETYKRYVSRGLVECSGLMGGGNSSVDPSSESNRDPYLLFNCGQISFGNLAKFLEHCAK